MITFIFNGKLIGGERKFRSTEACEAFALGVAVGCPEALHGDCAVYKVGYVSPITGKEVRTPPRTVVGDYADLEQLAAQWGVSI